MVFHSKYMKFDTDLERFRDKTAVVLEDASCMSYDMLVAQCRIFEKHMGTSKKLICILCQNNLETIIGYLSALRAGHTVMMLNCELDHEFIESLIDKYQPDYIWQSKNQKVVGVYEYGEYILSRRNTKLKKLHKDLTLLLSTSGSTGSPKFVKLTKRNLYANTSSIVEYLKIDQNERAITSLPLHYSYGLSILNTHLAVGATLLLTGKSIISKEFWEFFKQEKATSFAGVPYTYEMLKKIRFFKMALPSLRTLTQAGGKLNPKLVKEFGDYAHDKEIAFYVMYGQTEATARISYLPPKYVQSHHKSIGVAIPGGEIKLIDIHGSEISEPDVEGELVYYGENVMMGYAMTLDDLAKCDEQNGSLRTGDVAYRDSDGYYYITGRTKRFIKIFGNRVNLDDIEHYLKSKGFDCLCTGEDDLLKIAILDPLIEKSLKSTLMDKYPFHPKALEVVCVSEFPISSSGKIEYNKLFDNVKMETDA